MAATSDEEQARMVSRDSKDENDPELVVAVANAQYVILHVRMFLLCCVLMSSTIQV